jgi:hypothetical protein
MPLLVLFLVALAVASAVAFVAWHYPMPIGEPTPSVAAAKAVGRELGHHSRLRRIVKSRLNPEVATGLALTVALGVVIVGGIVLGALAYPRALELGPRRSRQQRRAVGRRSLRPGLREGLTLITQLGESWFAVVLVIVISVVGYLDGPIAGSPCSFSRSSSVSGS